jgi:hypothetical protein
MYGVVLVGVSTDPSPKFFARMGEAKAFAIASVNKARLAEGADIYEVRNVNDELAADRAFREGQRAYCRSIGRRPTQLELDKQEQLWTAIPPPAK